MSLPDKTRALIYNRVSADPTGRRISTASQDTENRAFCARQGWTVVATITDDDRSASRYAARRREGYATVKQALAGHTHGRIDVLVCWEASRANRDLGDYVQLRELCAAEHVLLAYKGRVYDLTEGDDRFTTGLDALVAEREADQIRDRILRSHRSSVERGTPRGVIPYGYQREYDPHTGHMTGQTLHPDTAAVVRGIVARVLDGATLYVVAQDLNRRGVPTPRQHQDARADRIVERAGWSSSMIRNLLRKPSLTGIRTHHGIPTGDGTWPALIPADQWRKVQAVLDDPLRSRNPAGVAVRFLLSGIAECEVCRAWLRPLTHRGRGTYQCAGSVPTAGKGHVSRSRDHLDAMVTRAVIERVSRPDFLEWYARALGTVDDAAQTAAAAEVAHLEARLAEHEASSLDPHGITPAHFAKVEKSLRPLIEAARARLSSPLAHPVVLELAGPGAAATWARWGGEPDGLGLQRQAVRALLRVVVHRVVDRGARDFETSSIELAWRGDD